MTNLVIPADPVSEEARQMLERQLNDLEILDIKRTYQVDAVRQLLAMALQVHRLEVEKNIGMLLMKGHLQQASSLLGCELTEVMREAPRPLKNHQNNPLR